MRYSLKQAFFFFSINQNGCKAVFEPSLLLQHTHASDEAADFLLHQAAESLQMDVHTL